MKQSKSKTTCELSKKQRNCISAAKYRLKKKEMNLELEKRVKYQQKQIEQLQNQVNCLQQKQSQTEKELDLMKQIEIKQNYIIQNLQQTELKQNNLIQDLKIQNDKMMNKSFTDQELMDMFFN